MNRENLSELFFLLKKWRRTAGGARMENLSSGEVEVLGAVFFCENAHNASISDLAEWMDVSLPAVSRAVGRLEEKGCVVRTGDGADRRNVSVALTDRGRDRFRRAQAALEQFFRRVLGYLTEEEQREFFRLSEKFAEGMRVELKKNQEEAL